MCNTNLAKSSPFLALPSPREDGLLLELLPVRLIHAYLLELQGLH